MWPNVGKKKKGGQIPRAEWQPESWELIRRYVLRKSQRLLGDPVKWGWSSDPQWCQTRTSSQMLMPGIPTLGRLREQTQEFWASMSYIASSRLSWAREWEPGKKGEEEEKESSATSFHKKHIDAMSGTQTGWNWWREDKDEMRERIWTGCGMKTWTVLRGLQNSCPHPGVKHGSQSSTLWCWNRSVPWPSSNKAPFLLPSSWPSSNGTFPVCVSCP